jgi:superfamily II RNA helicase
MAEPSSQTLASQLPPKGVAPTADELLSRFLTSVSQRGLTLYPAQEEAILGLLEGQHVILGTPTGSGKSLVAEALHFKGMAEGKVSFYTCPIKALVNEKFFALCEAFGPENVGMMTGDAAVNRGAPIVCCTAEILMNLALREEGAHVDYVVMDEFHYYADKERGVAWQIPLLSLSGATFLLMSATLGPTDHIEEHLERLTRRPVAVVKALDRPVPLDYEYAETPIHETIAHLIERQMAPIYLVNFTQRAAAEEAQALTSVNLCTKEEKEALRIALQGAKFDTPYGKDIQKYLRAGIGLHHAGVMPKYRRLTERLAQRGLLKVISGTDTLGMGVNVPIRTVLFTRLCKFDGEKMGILKGRDFHQIAGRAGRKGFDDRGLVVAQAPEHVIENLRLAAKSSGKKFQKKQPPQKGYVHWDRSTFERLQTRLPEPLESRFQVTHGMLINLLQADEVWPRGGYARLVELIARSHESDNAKRRHRRRAAQMFRALERAGIIEVVRYAEGAGAYVEVSPDLQRDFSLYHTLSLFLLKAVELLDPASESYALDLLSLVESILEDPTPVLLRQSDKAKDEKMAEMKANGVPYEERIEELQKVEYPKPNAEFIYGAFAGFAERHPWVGGEDIRPKSVARDLFERLSSFGDYVVEYGLQRSEGVLLRYLSEVYRALTHTVPEAARDEAVEDVRTHLRELLRSVDSSLIDEWERLRSGGALPPPMAPMEAESEPLKLPEDDPRVLAQNPKAFAARVRNELHRLLKAVATRSWDEALAAIHPLEGEPSWTREALEQAMEPYFAEHPSVDLKPRSRLPHNTVLRPDGELRWEAIQKIVDPEGEADWMLDCIVDLGAARPEGAPLIALRRIGT